MTAQLCQKCGVAAAKIMAVYTHTDSHVYMGCRPIWDQFLCWQCEPDEVQICRAHQCRVPLWAGWAIPAIDPLTGAYLMKSADALDSWRTETIYRLNQMRRRRTASGQSH
jgi:hypothetical protein